VSQQSEVQVVLGPTGLDPGCHPRLDYSGSRGARGFLLPARPLQRWTLRPVPDV